MIVVYLIDEAIHYNFDAKKFRLTARTGHILYHIDNARDSIFIKLKALPFYHY